jgi:hypothetical protein
MLRLKYKLEGKHNALIAHNRDATSLKNLIEIINKLIIYTESKTLSSNQYNFLIEAESITFLYASEANNFVQMLIDSNINIAQEYLESNHSSSNNWMTTIIVFFSCFAKSSATIHPEQEYIYRTITDEMTFGGQTHVFGEKKYHFEDPKDYDMT